MSEAKRYLVLVQLGDTNPQRLKTVVPDLLTILNYVSTDKAEQLFRAVQADVFGYLIKSTLRPTRIVKEIESPGKDPMDSKSKRPDIWPFLNNKDAIVVVEVGVDFSSTSGFSRAATWLQRH